MTEYNFDVPIPEYPEGREQRNQALVESLEERILVLDGATGTGLQDENLTAEDFGGPDLEGCNENLCKTRPDVILRLHERYLAAGADIVETNSFGATPLVLAEYGLEDEAFELNRLSAALAREACAKFDEPGRPRFVCGSMGPTTKAISVTGGVTFEELQEHYRVEALGLMAGGADYLLLETCQDTRNVKAGLLAIERAFADAGWRVPVAVSVTIETTGTMLAGQDAEALAVSLLHSDLLYLGLNCATGPELMSDHLRTLSELVRTRVACVPNAGLPDEDGLYHEGREEFVQIFSRFLDSHWLNLVGGCCGTTDKHVAALAELVKGRKPRQGSHHQRSMVSGIEAVELTADNRPLLVGERTNVLGSRKFKRLVAEGEFEAAAEIGRGQARSGAQVLDICMQDPDREEVEDVERFLEQVTRMVKLPLMIDTTDAEVMERALTWCQGKAVLNSINLEEGQKRFDQVVPLAQKFGAALIVGLIDETGMAVSVERKAEVARRSYRILTEEMAFPPEDIWFDALVFPCGTGDENYIGSAASTIEGVRWLATEAPLAKTVLGVSNVSFGLPAAGREVLNSVFLYHCTQAGLDAALVNTQRLARYADIPEEERQLAENLIFLEPGDTAGSDKAITEFTEYFRDRTARVETTPRSELPLEERLARAVIEGSKEGLLDDLDLALADERWPEPLDIINGPLMTGMSEVGRLFNDNQLIVAEVLQSAEVMKAAVGHLEQHMDKIEGSSRGKILLATVKGDVHDIGKNLVDIILSNNGYEVVNLGIKIPSEQLIQAVREHRPDVIGLSGLLVKSAQQMVTTAEDLSVVDIDLPLVVGGAALTRRFTHKKIAPAYMGFSTYAKDAMHGLSLVDQLTDPEKRPLLEKQVAEIRAKDQESAGPSKTSFEPATGKRSSAVRVDLEIPAPPHLDRVVEELDLDEVWSQINPQMLYGKHLGLKGSVKQLEAKHDPKLAKLKKVVVDIQDVARAGSMHAKAVWQFFPAASDGNRLILHDSGSGDPIVTWELPRQRGTDGLCLSDYILPGGDHVGMLVTTAGDGVIAQVEKWKEEGEYLKSHAFAALALETAEAAAEVVHQKLRELWSFADPSELTLQDRFSARYRGKRYSFGYPACPDLSMQQQLFAVLQPDDIGVTLTEGDMMEPEASVSALVIPHPDARYFGV
jgi:5-methyltetrahydrofolate--homocysteine methyltransferase